MTTTTTPSAAIHPTSATSITVRVYDASAIKDTLKAMGYTLDEKVMNKANWTRDYTDLTRESLLAVKAELEALGAKTYLNPSKKPA